MVVIGESFLVSISVFGAGIKINIESRALERTKCSVFTSTDLPYKDALFPPIVGNKFHGQWHMMKRHTVENMLSKPSFWLGLVDDFFLSL